jgi:uncharacterized protein YcfJ
MRRILLPLTAFSLMLPVSFVGFTAPASAHVRNYAHHHYHGRVIRDYRRCRHSPGNAGLLAGGVGGAVVGSQVIGGGLVGVAAGAVGGALAGRAIDRGMTARRRGCR